MRHAQDYRDIRIGVRGTRKDGVYISTARVVRLDAITESLRVQEPAVPPKFFTHI